METLSSLSYGHMLCGDVYLNSTLWEHQKQRKQVLSAPFADENLECLNDLTSLLNFYSLYFLFIRLICPSFLRSDITENKQMHKRFFMNSEEQQTAM